MILGFALTHHCNLRCPHCIRDDVTTVQSFDVDLYRRVVDEARAQFGSLTVSFTGGEPTLHAQWEQIVAHAHARGVPYRFTSNGWHMRRLMPLMDRYPAEQVRLSLSGADEAVHDQERGRGSFRRVLMAVALLTSRRIPTSLSIVIDRRSRHQIRQAADLAEALGCIRLHVILPQPVPGSAKRGSDLLPEEWLPIRREVQAIAREAGRRTIVALDYGAPFDGDEISCDVFGLQRAFLDAAGRLSLCCQLSEYGNNEADVTADLNEMSFAEAWEIYSARVAGLRREQAPHPESTNPLDAFPCMRCARALGKTSWLSAYPDSPWAPMAGPVLVSLGPPRRTRAVAATT